MGLIADRLRNFGLNLGLIVGAVAAFALIYALVIRWTGPQSAPLGRAVGDLGDIIQVDVRNGCGVSDLAAQMTEYLRDNGFDVLEAGNHTTVGEELSMVLDRVGNPRAAQALARAVGLGEDRVREAIRDDYFLDATLVIGTDYASLYPFSEDNNAEGLAPCP